MTDLKTRFEKATVDVLQLAQRPDEDTLLKLYSLYKQATAGNVTGQRPYSNDITARAKYDARDNLRGMSQAKAMEEYIALVELLMG